MEPLHVCENAVASRSGDTARLILRRIEEVYPDADGRLPRFYPAGRDAIYPDFDDVMPFVLYFGRDEFVVRQIEVSRRSTWQGLIAFNGKIVSWRNDEYLGALCAFYRKKGGSRLRRWIEEGAGGLRQYLFHDGQFRAYYDVRRRKASPVAAPWTGGLLEVLLENSDLFPDWEQPALTALDGWLRHEPFQRYGLFASKEFLGRPRRNRLNNGWRSGVRALNHPMWHSTGYYLNPSAGWKPWLLEKAFDKLYPAPLGFHFQFMKMNTSLVFALIAAFRLTRDERYREAVRHWIAAVRSRLFVDGRLCTDWSPYHHNRQVSTLTDTFILIDVLCDAAVFLDMTHETLDFARTLADGWLTQRWACGLFPMQTGGDTALIDNQVDFAIALRRLAELTGEDAYRDASRAGLDPVLDFFPTEQGFASLYHRDRGVDPAAPVDIKYNALLLKLLISELEADTSMYQDLWLHDLLKDR